MESLGGALSGMGGAPVGNWFPGRGGGVIDFGGKLSGNCGIWFSSGSLASAMGPGGGAGGFLVISWGTGDPLAEDELDIDMSADPADPGPFPMSASGGF